MNPMNLWLLPVAIVAAYLIFYLAVLALVGVWWFLTYPLHQHRRMD